MSVAAPRGQKRPTVLVSTTSCAHALQLSTNTTSGHRRPRSSAQSETATAASWHTHHFGRPRSAIRLRYTIRATPRSSPGGGAAKGPQPHTIRQTPPRSQAVWKSRWTKCFNDAVERCYAFTGEKFQDKREVGAPARDDRGGG